MLWLWKPFEDITLLKTIFQEQNFSAVYFKNDIDKAYYLTGYGTRAVAKLYKTIYQFPEFDIRYKLIWRFGLSQYPTVLLVKMIQVFEELGFVTIKDGVMTVNKAPKGKLEKVGFTKISNRPLKIKKWWRWVLCKKSMTFNGKRIKLGKSWVTSSFWKAKSSFWKSSKMV